MTYDELTEQFVYYSDPVTITDAHVVLLGGLIGNLHPSHLSDAYSERVGPFGRKVAHGELIHALMITGFAQVLRTTSNGQLGGTYRLLAPVFIGDTVHTEITVANKRPTRSGTRGIVDFELRTYKQDGTVVAEGTADFLVTNEPLDIYAPETVAASQRAATTSDGQGAA